jgi:PAS domain S-box-containing protein
VTFGIERYRQLFYEAPVAMALLSADTLTLVLANRGAEELLATLGAEAFEGRALGELFAGEARERQERLVVQALEQGRSSLIELELRGPLGARMPVEASLGSLGEAADRYVTIALRDITARRRLANERDEMARALFETQKLEAIGQLSAGVAHDMNNVLAAILASASNQDQSSPRELADALREIRSTALRGRELTDRLSSLYRKSPIRAHTFDMVDLVRQVVALLRRTLPATITLEALLPDESWWLDGDDDAWRQALLNLAINARDAMPDGGLLRLECVAMPSGREVRVSDSGTGMTPEVLARAFEPFFTTKPFGSGTGLGLSLVRAVTLAHRAEVRCESTPGRGTHFRLVLPRESSSESHAGASHGPDQLPESVDVRPRLPPTQVSRRAISSRKQLRGRILLVDDDDIVRQTTARLLRRVGIQVAEAPSARDALVMIDDAGPFDVVVSDLAMPLMDGEALAGAILERRPTQAFVMVTGGLRDERLQRLQELGVKEVLTKPFTVPEILAALAPLFPK